MALNNHTYDIGYKSSALFPIAYKMEIDNIHIDSVSGFTTKVFEMEPGSDKVHIKFGGIDAKFFIDGSLKFLYFIPFDVSSINITNITIDFTLQSFTAKDKVHWRLDEDSKFSFGTLKIGMKDEFL